MVKIYHAVNAWSGHPRVPRFPKDYVHVATVETVHLGAAFMLTQNGARSWVSNDSVETVLTECRSTSIGDVLELKGEYYMVEYKGFSKMKKKRKWLWFFLEGTNFKSFIRVCCTAY
jgi:hypothetical protein